MDVNAEHESRVVGGALTCAGEAAALAAQIASFFLRDHAKDAPLERALALHQARGRAEASSHELQRAFDEGASFVDLLEQAALAAESAGETLRAVRAILPS